jgi:hypothetical protein
LLPEEEEALGEEDLSIILTGTARDRSQTDQRFPVAAIAIGLALARLRPAHR